MAAARLPRLKWGRPTGNEKEQLISLYDLASLFNVSDKFDGKHGGDRKSEKAKIQVDNIKLNHKGGTQRAYTIARLERDDLSSRNDKLSWSHHRNE